MNEGKRFEENFKKSAKIDNLLLIRLQDAAGWSDAENTRFTPSNVCDFILYNGIEMHLIELKSHKSTSIAFNQMKQIDKMIKYSYVNLKKYVIIEFRKYTTTVAIPVDKLIEFREATSKKSINLKECAEIGTIIPQTKKQVNYTYDLSKFRIIYSDSRQATDRILKED